MKISIPAKVFQAVALFAAKCDVRYYINGLSIEAGHHGARLAATTGDVLCVAEIPGCFWPATSIIIPREAVAHLKIGARDACVVIHYEATRKNDNHQQPILRQISLQAGQCEVVATEVDGRFPDYRRVIPRAATHQLAQYDPANLAILDKANRILNGTKYYPGIQHNGAGPGLCVLRHDVCAIVTPLHVEPLDTAPAWVHAPLGATEQAHAA